MPNPNVAKPEFLPFSEASDTHHWEFFETLHLSYELPKIGGVFQVTKFHILLTLVAFIVGVMMIWLGRKMKNGDVPRGTLWNMLESLLFFVRDDIARPGIGEHDADKYVPYLTTTFLFILVANMLGMIPFMGSPTASIAVTAALAVLFDWLIEPVAVKLGYWQWKGDGSIPMYNYICWAVISALLLAVFHFCAFNKQNKFAIHLLLIQALFFLLLRTFLK